MQTRKQTGFPFKQPNNKNATKDKRISLIIKKLNVCTFSQQSQQTKELLTILQRIVWQRCGERTLWWGSGYLGSLMVNFGPLFRKLLFLRPFTATSSPTLWEESDATSMTSSCSISDSSESVKKKTAAWRHVFSTRTFGETSFIHYYVTKTNTIEQKQRKLLCMR